jgi:hypothetical protein
VAELALVQRDVAPTSGPAEERSDGLGAEYGGKGPMRGLHSWPRGLLEALEEACPPPWGARGGLPPAVGGLEEACPPPWGARGGWSRKSAECRRRPGRQRGSLRGRRWVLSAPGGEPMGCGAAAAVGIVSPKRPWLE